MTEHLFLDDNKLDAANGTLIELRLNIRNKLICKKKKTTPFIMDSILSLTKYHSN